MLISSSKRQTLLSQDGLRSEAAHLGPGKYAVGKHSIGTRRRQKNFTAFGSSNQRNLVPIKEGPGPGRFQKNQFDFDKKKHKADLSSAFKTKQVRFQTPKSDNELGPGTYDVDHSDFDMAKQRRRSTATKSKASRSTILPRGPVVPSVPHRGHSFGYNVRADGSVVPQKPTRKSYGGDQYGNPNDVNDRTSWISKQIKDTVGPAYYNRPNDSSFSDAISRRSRPGKTVGGHVPFAKSKSERRLFEKQPGQTIRVPDPDNPGPGKYNFHIKLRQKRRKQATSSFASGVPQLHDPHQIYRATLPGPSNYHPVDDKYRNSVNNAGVAAFGTHTGRSSIIIGDPSEVPGPGSYNTNSGAFQPKESSISMNISDVETAFGSTAERPCLAATKVDVDVGPGSYGDSRTFSALTQTVNKNAEVGKLGKFGSTANRFRPKERLDGSKIQDNPGVGHYKMKKPRFQRDREGSSFRSTANRRARPTTGLPQYVMVGKNSTPAPGTYNPAESLAIGGKSVAAESTVSKPFGTRAPRLRQDEIFMQRIPQAGPGPGDYDSATSSTMAHKILGRFGIKSRGTTPEGFGATTVRFGKTQPAGETHGSGFDTNSMIKKSFNKRAGYTPTKPPDRRVLRTITDRASTGIGGHAVQRSPRSSSAPGKRR